jgi:hypothetical protein
LSQCYQLRFHACYKLRLCHLQGIQAITGFRGEYLAQYGSFFCLILSARLLLLRCLSLSAVLLLLHLLKLAPSYLFEIFIHVCINLVLIYGVSKTNILPEQDLSLPALF